MPDPRLILGLICAAVLSSVALVACGGSSQSHPVPASLSKAVLTPQKHAQLEACLKAHGGVRHFAQAQAGCQQFFPPPPKLKAVSNAPAPKPNALRGAIVNVAHCMSQHGYRLTTAVDTPNAKTPQERQSALSFIEAAALATAGNSAVGRAALQACHNEVAAMGAPSQPATNGSTG